MSIAAINTITKSNMGRKESVGLDVPRLPSRKVKEGSTVCWLVPPAFKGYLLRDGITHRRPSYISYLATERMPTDAH